MWTVLLLSDYIRPRYFQTKKITTSSDKVSLDLESLETPTIRFASLELARDTLFDWPVSFFDRPGRPGVVE